MASHLSAGSATGLRAGARPGFDGPNGRAWFGGLLTQKFNKNAQSLSNIFAIKDYAKSMPRRVLSRGFAAQPGAIKEARASALARRACLGGIKTRAEQPNAGVI